MHEWPFPEVWRAVATRADLDPVLAERIAHHEYALVDGYAILGLVPSYKDAGLLELLSKSPVAEIRAAVAANEHTHELVLDAILTNDAELLDVRLAAAENPATLMMSVEYGAECGDAPRLVEACERALGESESDAIDLT